MKTTEIKITYNLSHVNLVEKTGVLKIRQEHLSKGTVVNVDLSGQLVGKIKYYLKNPNKKGAFRLTDRDFTSALRSPEYKENPFKLVKFIRDGQSSFKLQMVDDKGFEIKEYVNAMNQRVEHAIFKHWKASQYIRFWTVDFDTRKA